MVTLRKVLGAALITLAISFWASLFANPSVLTLLLFVASYPILAAGLYLILYGPGKLARWKFKGATAIVLRQEKKTKEGDALHDKPFDSYYDFYRYDPNDPTNWFVPENIRKFCYDTRYLMPIKGWHVGGKHDSWKKKLKRTILPKKQALFIFDESTGLPVIYSSSLNTGFDRVSPEFMKALCESKIAANFSKSLDKKTTNIRTIMIFGIVAVVIVVFLRIAGVF
jgi:hypothetical protein